MDPTDISSDFMEMLSWSDDDNDNDEVNRPKCSAIQINHTPKVPLTPSQQLERVGQVVSEMYPQTNVSNNEQVAKRSNLPVPFKQSPKISSHKAASIKKLLTSPAKQVKGLFNNWVFSPGGTKRYDTDGSCGTKGKPKVLEDQFQFPGDTLHDQQPCRRKLSFQTSDEKFPVKGGDNKGQENQPLNRNLSFAEIRPRTLVEESHHKTIKRNHSFASDTKSLERNNHVSSSDCFPFQKHYEEMFRFHKTQCHLESPLMTPLKRHESLMEFKSPLAIRKPASSMSYQDDPSIQKRHNTMPIMPKHHDNCRDDAYVCDDDIYLWYKKRESKKNFDELSLKIWIIQYLDNMDSLFHRHSRDTALTLRLTKIRDLNDTLKKWPNLDSCVKRECVNLINRYQSNRGNNKGDLY